MRAAIEIKDVGRNGTTLCEQSEGGSRWVKGAGGGNKREEEEEEEQEQEEEEEEEDDVDEDEEGGTYGRGRGGWLGCQGSPFPPCSGTCGPRILEHHHRGN